MRATDEIIETGTIDESVEEENPTYKPACKIV